MLFNTYEVGNPYLLHTPPTNDTKIFRSPGLAKKIMRKSLEFGAIRGFRAAKGDCTGPVSARICERAGLVAVHKLLYDEYKVNNKVVFQNTPTRGPALTVVAARLQDTEPYVRPLEELSKLYIWQGGASQCVWCCSSLTYTTKCAEITPSITIIRKPLEH